MRVIVSHDVDHLTFSEHWRDLILPKFIARMGLEAACGSIQFCEIGSRLLDMLHNKRQNLLELLAYDQDHGIRPTFFIGMARGLGLSYSVAAATDWVELLSARACDLGIHGIAFADLEAMRQEQARFAAALGHYRFGMRMHYLRRDSGTMDRLATLGYPFDTTIPGDGGPRRGPGGMWLFPLHMMDGWYLLGDRRYQIHSAREAFLETRHRIDQLEYCGVDYLTINFHDSYFSNSYLSWKEWYKRVIDDLIARDSQFISYSQAIELLEVEGLGDLPR